MAASTGRRSSATTKTRSSASARTAESPRSTASHAEGAGGPSAQAAAALGAMPGFGQMPGFDPAALGAMGEWLKPDAWSRLWQGQGASAMPGFDAFKGAMPNMPGLPSMSPTSFDPQAGAALGQGLFSSLQSLAGLSVPSDALGKIQQDYMQQAASLWNTALEKPADLSLDDRRFASPEWKSNPGSAYLAAMYLLNARTLRSLADQLQGDDKARERVRFAVQQWIDAASPSNYLALNPEAQKKALDTKGESISKGIQHLMHDIRQGHMSQTDESVFEVGRNVATTEGTVVFENAFFQLIEYKPLTEKVRATPFLLVPPCINKFYILDLQPDNSLVRYAVSQGQRVFVVSWVNADESLSKATWDDYIDHGVIRAIQAVKDIVGVEQINALGFCIGGTLVATALAVLAARGEKPVKSLTLLTSFLDFANTGTMDIFVDEAAVQMREMTMGANSPAGGGLMKGGDLATTFSFLRANDLVWNYVVGNYLKGEMPPAFDLLYWNSDSTNLPGPMYCWYLRNTYLENKLKQPGKTVVCGEKVDLRTLDMPAFIYGSREDHIVPWDGAFASTRLLTGEKTFVLGASGHIAGVINPPEKKKRSFWSLKNGSKLPTDHKAWLAAADEHPGSWWPTWAAWLDHQGGAWVKAPAQPGSKAYPAIEPAPGRYVKRRA